MSGQKEDQSSYQRFSLLSKVITSYQRLPLRIKEILEKIAQGKGENEKEWAFFFSVRNDGCDLNLWDNLLNSTL